MERMQKVFGGIPKYSLFLRIRSIGRENVSEFVGVESGGGEVEYLYSNILKERFKIWVIFYKYSFVFIFLNDFVSYYSILNGQIKIKIMSESDFYPLPFKIKYSCKSS